MKPIASPQVYSNIVRTTKTYLLLLSGGIAMLVLIVFMQLFSYATQRTHSTSFQANTQQVSRIVPVVHASIVSIKAQEPPVTNEAPQPDLNALPAIVPPVTEIKLPLAIDSLAKAAALIRTQNAFLKQNEIKNDSVVKELSKVVEMHEFHFAKNSSSIEQQNGMEKLDSCLQKCIEVPESWSKIIVLGFTDNRGSKIANVRLGMKRAEKFKALLVAKGVPAEKITIASFGAELPIASNNNEKGRSINRRVEFNLLAAGG